MIRITKQGLAVACAAALLGAGGIAAAAPAGATAENYACNATTTAPFYTSPGGSWVYSVSAGGGISDTGTATVYAGQVYHYGHGNGHSDAWFREGDTNC